VRIPPAKRLILVILVVIASEFFWMPGSAESVSDQSTKKILSHKTFTKESGASSPSQTPLCTSFALERGGFIIHGENVEHESIHKGQVFINPRDMQKWGLDESTDGRIARWRSAYGSVTFNLVGYQYASGGMNEAGLTISGMSLKGSQVPEPDERPPLDEPLWVQYLLDNFSTVQQVIASEKQVRLTDTNSHFLVCDRTGVCATIEFLGGRMVVNTGDDLPLKVLTNTVYQDALQALRRGFLGDGSLRCFSIAAARVNDFNSQDDVDPIGYAFETLARVTAPEVRTPPAQWSMVFDAQGFKLYFRTKNNPQIRTLEFSKLDFTCRDNVLMMDIHTGKAGDVSASFEPYAHAPVVAHFNQFFDVWGLDITPEQTEAFVHKLEEYHCGEIQTLPPEPPVPVAGGFEDTIWDRFILQVWWVWTLGIGLVCTAVLSVYLKQRSIL
jgi:penicillin V acylase-like amidase (Ntn superfamily)